MSNKSLNLTDRLYDYMLSNSLREPAVMKSLRDETAKLPTCIMQISPEQGQFMALIIELMGAKKTLEIGTYTGYSALAVALALPADGKVITCDIDKTNTQIAQNYWQKAGVAEKIDLRIAPAAETLEKLIAAGEKESFDFAFIDADKGGYDNYYEKALILLRKNGLIMIDNTLWDGAVADPNDNDQSTVAIRALNAKLHQDDRITLSLIPLGDGLTLARKH